MRVTVDIWRESSRLHQPRAHENPQQGHAGCPPKRCKVGFSGFWFVNKKTSQPLLVVHGCTLAGRGRGRKTSTLRVRQGYTERPSLRQTEEERRG